MNCRTCIPTAIFIGVALFLLAAGPRSANGPISGVTGGPGDFAGACTFCHYTNPLNTGDGLVEISGPDSYQAGATLELTVRAAKPGAARFGFEIVAKDDTDAAVGTWEVTEGTQWADGGFTAEYLTHEAGAPFSADEHEWTVRWIPPVNGAGDVTFYAAGNAADGDASQFGDFIYTTSKPVAMAGNTSIHAEEIPQALKVTSIYPNPARSFTTVSFDLNRAATVELTIFDLLGKRHLFEVLDQQQPGNHDWVLDTSTLPNGVYGYRIVAGGHSATGVLNRIQ